jgi:isopenicillin-N epimerase
MNHALPEPSPLFRHWSLSPDVCFLNHGSFGACPTAVLDAQSRLRSQMEREPVRFFVEELTPALDAVRERIAAFVHCDPSDLVFVPNATTGVATALMNLRIEPGDEILVNTHEYPACMNNAGAVARRRGASVVRAGLPFPITSAQEAMDAILSCVTDRTRVCLLSHITSPTALVLPIERLVPQLRSRGVDVVVDGAHAIGNVPIDLDALGADCYTSNCHKWLCAPKGAAFLHVRRDRQEGFRPTILSNDAVQGKPGRSQFQVDFDYVGTNDYTACLTIPATMDVMAGMVGGGWDAIRAHNHDLARSGRDLLCERLGVEPPSPQEMSCSIATVILPRHDAGLHERLAARPTRHHDALQDALMDRHGIEVPVWPALGTDRFVRVSAQLYNSIEQYAYLADALVEELARERTY